MTSGGHNPDIIAPRSIIIPSYANADLPGNAPDGSLAIDTTNNKLMVRVNGGWETVTST